MCQRVLRHAGGVESCPVERAQLVAFLLACDSDVSVGSVGGATGDAREPGCQIGRQEQPMEAKPVGLGHGGDCRSLLGPSKYRIDNRAMAGGDGAAGFVGERGVGSACHVGRIGRGRQLLGLGMPEQGLALDVGAQHDGARDRRQIGGDGAGKQRFARARGGSIRRRARSK